MDMGCVYYIAQAGSNASCASQLRSEIFAVSFSFFLCTMLVDAGGLVCAIADDVEIFENVNSHTLVRHARKDEVLTAAGPPVSADGYVMLPLMPKGAVQIDWVKVAASVDAPTSQTLAPPASPLAASIAYLSEDSLLSATLQMGSGAGGTTHMAYASASSALSETGSVAGSELDAESTVIPGGGADLCADVAEARSRAAASDPPADAVKERWRIETLAAKNVLVAAEERLERRRNTVSVLSRTGAAWTLRSAAVVATRKRQVAEQLCCDQAAAVEKEREVRRYDERCLEAADRLMKRRKNLLADAEAIDGPESDLLRLHAAALQKEFENERAVQRRAEAVARMEKLNELNAQLEVETKVLQDARQHESDAQKAAVQITLAGELVASSEAEVTALRENFNEVARPLVAALRAAAVRRRAALLAERAALVCESLGAPGPQRCDDAWERQAKRTRIGSA